MKLDFECSYVRNHTSYFIWFLTIFRLDFLIWSWRPSLWGQVFFLFSSEANFLAIKMSAHSFLDNSYSSQYPLGWALFAHIHRIISLVQYVVRGHMGSLYVDFHCSRSSGTPNPLCTLISIQKQAFAEFEKWPPFSFLPIFPKQAKLETWG